MVEMPTLASLLSWSKKRPSLKRDQCSFGRKDSGITGLQQVYLPDKNEMKLVFAKLDADNDKRISAAELSRMLKALGNTDDNLARRQAEQMVQVADTNCDGFIDFQEFMDVHAKDGGVTDAEIRRAFMILDLNGDGKISAEELRTVLGRLGERCSLDMCRKMVRAVDSDGDELVNMDDFMAMMTKTMKLVAS